MVSRLILFLHLLSITNMRKWTLAALVLVTLWGHLRLLWVLLGTLHLRNGYNLIL